MSHQCESKKARILDLKDHPILLDFQKKLSENKTRTAERVEWLKQQEEKLKEDFEKTHEAIWGEIYTYLAAHVTLPDWYKKGETGLSFDEDLGILIANKKCSQHGSLLEGFLELLKQ